MNPRIPGLLIRISALKLRYEQNISASLCQYYKQVNHLFTTTVSRWRSLKNLPRERDRVNIQAELLHTVSNQPQQSHKINNRLVTSIGGSLKPLEAVKRAGTFTVLSSRWSEWSPPHPHSHTSLLSRWLSPHLPRQNNRIKNHFHKTGKHLHTCLLHLHYTIIITCRLTRGELRPWFCKIMKKTLANWTLFRLYLHHG